MLFDHFTNISIFCLNHLNKSRRMFFNHRTCAGQQTGAEPRPQEPVGVGFVNLTGAAQQDL
jgi:hypothetical protein